MQPEVQETKCSQEAGGEKKGGIGIMRQKAQKQSSEGTVGFVVKNC